MIRAGVILKQEQEHTTQSTYLNLFHSLLSRTHNALSIHSFIYQARKKGVMMMIWKKDARFQLQLPQSGLKLQQECESAPTTTTSMTHVACGLTEASGRDI